MTEYRNSSHTVYDIKYHFVWITKYRYKVLKGKVAYRTRELLQQGCDAKKFKNTERKHRTGSCAYVTIMSNRFGTQSDYAISKGKIIPSIARRISGTQEKILGAAYVGTGIFLWDGRGSR